MPSSSIIIFEDIDYAFRVTFLNKCDEAERTIISEYYQRCMGTELPQNWTNTIEENASDVKG